MVVNMSFADCIDKSKGYVPLWRSIIHWEWYEDKNTCTVYQYCYMRAAHKDTKYLGKEIKRGSFITSLEKLAENTNLSVRNVRTAISHLKETNDIEVVTSRKGSIISVKNYDYIVSKDDKSTQKVTSDRHTADTPPTSINNVNNYNNVDVVGAGAPTTDYSDDFLKFWEVYSKKSEKYKSDTFELWNEKKYTSKEVEQILHGARMYSEEMKCNKYMVYARRFLEDEMWKDYPMGKSDDGLDNITPEMLERYMNCE